MRSRLAITMRRAITMYPDGPELRDALACDWSVFLSAVLPECCWFPVPNTGAEVVRLVEEFHIDGLILSGGENRGVFPQRDNTETALLLWARGKKLPVLGVCRGAQMLNFFSGGRQPQPVPGHVAVRHTVKFSGGRTAEVNSYHTGGLMPEDLSPVLRVTAEGPDGTVEAFEHTELPWRGILWHPEREATPAEQDRRLFTELFTGQL